MDTPVARIGAALDETGGIELVDESGERDRRHLQHLRQFALVRALAEIEPLEHGPLGALIDSSRARWSAWVRNMRAASCSAKASSRAGLIGICEAAILYAST